MRKLCVPLSRTQAVVILYRLAHTWNIIPTEVRAIVDEQSFKHCLLNLMNIHFIDDYKPDAPSCTWYIVCRRRVLFACMFHFI